MDSSLGSVGFVAVGALEVVKEVPVSGPFARDLTSIGSSAEQKHLDHRRSLEALSSLLVVLIKALGRSLSCCPQPLAKQSIVCHRGVRLGAFAQGQGASLQKSYGCCEDCRRAGGADSDSEDSDLEGDGLASQGQAQLEMSEFKASSLPGLATMKGLVVWLEEAGNKGPAWPGLLCCCVH